MERNIETRLCDVLIIGASMAGSCLARQLKIQHPNMDIVLIDKKTCFSHWVGESTLESFWDYAVKYLQLGYYLDANHFYKHGLRFFYDSPQKNLAIDEMSEVGRSWYHGTPAHQIDRKRFDEDLCHMNEESGIDVMLGQKVTNIEINAENGHLVTTQQCKIKCRYLIDAAGFASPIGKKLDLFVSHNKHHQLACYWARLKNINNLDLLGDQEWRARVHHTTRTLATTHFMYGHYWIWLIPIDRETFSIGVTSRLDMKGETLPIKDGESFIEFLKQHRCMRQLISHRTELLDYSQLKNFSRQAKQSFSTDRWFLTGISAAVLDPLLSSGSALLADNNRMIGDLIATDLKGKKEEFTRKTRIFNAYSQFWLENFFLHIKALYHDSYDRQWVHFETLLIQWFGAVLPTSMAESFGYRAGMTQKEVIEQEQFFKNCLKNSVIVKIDRLVEEFHRFLCERNYQYERNKGEFYDIEIDKQFTCHTRDEGKSLTPEKIAFIEEQMLRTVLLRCLTRMAEITGHVTTQERMNETVDKSVQEQLTLNESFQLLCEFTTVDTVCSAIQ